MKSLTDRLKQFLGINVGDHINLLSNQAVSYNKVVGIGAEVTGVIYRGIITQTSTSAATKTKDLNPYNFTVGYAESSGAIDLTFATTETPAPNFVAGDLIVKAHSEGNFSIPVFTFRDQDGKVLARTHGSCTLQHFKAVLSKLEQQLKVKT